MNESIFYEIKKLKKFFSNYVFCIGYSGGVDSSSLVYACYMNNVKIHLMHVNHNINNLSSMWEKFCFATSVKFNCSFSSYTLPICPKNENFESWASNERKNYFHFIASNYIKSIILLGHHLDDQSETFLIQALRGSSLEGLSCMPYIRKFKNKFIIRPFIYIDKNKLRKFCINNNIAWVYDVSNDDIKYYRNYVRHKVMPVINNMCFDVNKTLSKTIQYCSQSMQALNYFLNKEILKISHKVYKYIYVNHILSFPINIQKLLIKQWLKMYNTSFHSSYITEISTSIYNHHSGKYWFLKDDYYIILFNNKLCIKKIISIDKFSLLNIYNWFISRKVSCDKSYNINDIVIRNRKPGDKCSYVGRHKSNKLKIIFQELDIDILERRVCKIICDDKNNILAVYPFFVCI